MSKSNLAKVLGMEDMQQSQSNVIRQPSYEQEADQKIQDIGEVFEQTQYATDVALESIVSANRLMSVVANNNSTDKTAYAVLKTAVEQLKERTGVYTTSTALEDLSPLNYKSEGIEDIKKFVAKVWDAIKKALSFVKEKVKEFFAWIFKTKTDVVKQAEEAEKQAEELEKELRKAPKNEQEAKSYSSGYFDIKKNYFDDVKPSGTPALGHTANVSNKTFDKDQKFNTNDKQPDYSGNFSENTIPYREGSHSEFSQSVIDVLGYYGNKVNNLSDSTFSNDFKKLGADLKKLSGEMLDKAHNLYSFDFVMGDSIDDANFTLDKTNIKISTNIGDVDFIFESIQSESKYIFFIEKEDGKDGKLHGISVNALMECLNGFSSFTDKLINEDINKMESYISDFEDDIASASKRLGKVTDEVLVANLKKYQQYCNFKISVLKSIIVAIGRLVTYLVKVSKALIQAINDKINHAKHRFSHYLKRDGYIRDIEEFNKMYLGGSKW